MIPTFLPCEATAIQPEMNVPGFERVDTTGKRGVLVEHDGKIIGFLVFTADE